VTNALGNATIYEYDIRGRKTYEGGATYPVRYTYDEFGNKTTMTTYRNESLQSGDTTTWLYDEPTGLLTNKVYADGKGPTYSYTPDGKLSRRTWARGIVTDYSYDNWGSLTNRQYSDSTPHVSCAYDAMGRQVEMCSLSARTLISYDAFGRPVGEIITHDSTTNTILRHYDEYGRRVGHSLDGIRCVSLSFDPLTSRLDCMSTLGDTNYFHWLYKPCSNLKSALEYPNGLVCNLEYEPKRDLLVLARSVFNTNLISRCTYHYDAVGFRDQIDIAFGRVNESAPLSISRNEKSEITAITDALSGVRKTEYFYDDIGNRLSSNEHDHEFRYSSNSLCQPTQVITSNGVAIAQEYDLDGNQTLALTSTGLWSIQYDAENRPWQWTSGNTNIVMTFDGDGRRIKADVTVGGAMTSSNSFAYDGYDMIGEKSTRSTDGEVCEWRQTYVWLPFETVRSVPLVLCRGTNVYYYVSDGVKNVSAIVDSSGYTIASYDSHPLGGVRTITDETDGVLSNPFVFSSEYRDELLGVIHYAYRSYNSLQGRWLSRDLVDIPAVNPYALCSNTGRVDYRGTYDEIVHYYFLTWYLSHFKLSAEDKKLLAIVSIYVDYGKWAATKILDKKTVYNFERERNSKLLHNLGSLDKNKNGIECYRDCLKRLFTEEPLDPFQKGVLLHIIADTFAHQTISEESYGSFCGHLWDGTAPDDIRRSEVGEGRFRGFVNTLNDLFKADTATKEIVDRLLSDIYKGQKVWRERPWQIWVINPIVALFMPSGEWHFQYDLEDYRKKIMEISQAEWTSKEQIEENILKENRDASVEELLKSITDCFLKSGGKL
jgi:RHS repeat-associated protein